MLTDTDKFSDGKLRYGWFSFKPLALQKLNKPLTFVVVASICLFFQGALCTGYGNSALTTIERRFGLKTTQIALLGTFFHISAGIAGPFVGYFGHRHRPRFMAFGCISLLAGAVVVSLPHFISDPYVAGIDRSLDLCNISNVSSAVDSHAKHCDSVTGDSWSYLPIIICGYCLLGFGTVPLYSMATSHVADVCIRSQQAVYLSTIALSGLMGPAFGYMLGNPILSVYVDLRQPEGSHLKTGDKNWLGAWWLGYLAIASLLLFPLVPLLGFAALFPDTYEVRKSRVKLGDSIKENTKLKHNLASLLPATRELLRNGPLVAICTSNAAECLMLGGFATFLPKFLETQFQYTSSKAALYTGFLLVPGALVGISTGAYVSRRFAWDCRKSLRNSAIMSLIATVCLTCALIGCDSVDVVGHDVPYRSSDGRMQLDDTCRGNCVCSTAYYKPICTSSNKQTYFSPCHAGCSKENKYEINFYNCSCFPPGVYEATDGRCRQSCRTFPRFAAVAFLMMVFTFMSNVPVMNSIFRVVPEGQGSFAMGIQQVFIRFLGFIPAPTMFGRLIDRSCKIWLKDDCTSETQSCIEYENSTFRKYMFVLGGSCKLACFLLLLLAYKLYKPPRSTKEKQQGDFDGNERFLHLPIEEPEESRT